MTKMLGKMFGGIDLTWKKLIIAAVAAGIYTAAMAVIPAIRYSSLSTITVTFEVWILFGILIIMNSKSNLDSALKCFVFFLISQPLVYLLQVPFSEMGWGLFGYYRYWFILTVLCLPMGYIGFYMKRGKWWGYLILLPMIVLTATSYFTYFKSFLFYMPRYILICIFCASAVVLYPLMIFADRKIRTAGAVIGLTAVVAATVLGLLNPPVYSSEIMSSDPDHPFDDTCRVYLAEDKYGSVEIRYLDSLEDYVVHADFKRAGRTTMTIESPSGETREYDILIDQSTYEISPR